MGKDMIYGVENSKVASGAKYLVTANIKIMSTICVLSPWLTSMENHKTKQDMKMAMVKKLFLVNLIVYFYPFWYIAFLKDTVEGCPGGQDGCLQELRAYLLFFFIFHIVWVVLFVVLLPMASTLWNIRSEVHSKHAK